MTFYFSNQPLFNRLFNHIELASNLNPNCAYYFFKEGIRPMWEDSTNKAGGRWVINCMKKNFKAIDNYWMELVRFSIHRSDFLLS